MNLSGPSVAVASANRFSARMPYFLNAVALLHLGVLALADQLAVYSGNHPAAMLFFDLRGLRRKNRDTAGRDKARSITRQLIWRNASLLPSHRPQISRSGDSRFRPRNGFEIRWRHIRPSIHKMAKDLFVGPCSCTFLCHACALPSSWPGRLLVVFVMSWPQALPQPFPVVVTRPPPPRQREPAFTRP
jgi:hypothetical protein